MKSKTNDICAFPVVEGMSVGDVSKMEYVSKGMSLRDYFAAKAMQGIISNCWSLMTMKNVEELACDSYRLADAMLAERDK